MLRARSFAFPLTQRGRATGSPPHPALDPHAGSERTLLLPKRTSSMASPSQDSSPWRLWRWVKHSVCVEFFAWQSCWKSVTLCKYVLVLVCLSDSAGQVFWLQSAYGCCVSWSWTDVALNVVLQPEITSVSLKGRCLVYCSWFVFNKSFPAKPYTRLGLFRYVCSVKKQFELFYNSLFRVGVIYRVLTIHLVWIANWAHIPTIYPSILQYVAPLLFLSIMITDRLVTSVKENYKEKCLEGHFSSILRLSSSIWYLVPF